MEKQLRSYTAAANLVVETRTDGEKAKMLRGYAAVFNSRSELLGWFREILLPGSFAAPLKEKQDVRALLNHDPNVVLGRTTAGTLRLKQDNTGLACEIDLPDTQQARDLAVNVEAGNISQMSFAFQSRDYSWEVESGEYVRHVRSISKLFDVSPVTYPAYQATSVGLRAAQMGVPFDLDALLPVMLRADEGLPAMKEDPEVVRSAITQLQRVLDGLMLTGERTKDDTGLSVEEIGERLASLSGDVMDVEQLSRRLQMIQG